MTVTERRELIDQTEAGWYPDPDREHELRYHNGISWTDHVIHRGPTPCYGCHRPADH